MVLDFRVSAMHFHPQASVDGQVRPQLNVILSKKRRIPGSHSVFRLGRGAPSLHISQQEVGIADVDRRVAGRVLPTESEAGPINTTPRGGVVLLKHHLATEVENMLSLHNG